MKNFKLLLFLCFFYCLGIQGQIRLPKLISDNTILQRDQPVKIWGWASPNEKVTLLFSKKSFKTTTSQNGNWELLIPAHSAGAGYQMELKGKNEITIKNIAFGDVWLCNGISNMTLSTEGAKERFFKNSHSGPTLQSQTIENGKIILAFDNVGESIISKDGKELRWFSVADYNKKFVWAKVRIIEKNKIEVWNENIKTPKYVRYAWQDNPEDINFCNSENLPASPFRTDGEILDNCWPWKGKKCAVVLTYDDALNVHLDNVIPVLDSLGLKGTFYLTASSDACIMRINDWRKAAANGHELGNHTLFHPCDASGPGMSPAEAEYDLTKYSLGRIQDEILMCNAFLKAIDGKDKRTFAFTCGEKKTAQGEFIQTLSNEFIAARSVTGEMHTFEEQNLMDMDSFSMEGASGEQMIELVKQAQKSGKLLVFLFHGVGGEHDLNVSKEAHSQLVHYLKENQKDIYIDTMVNVAEHIKGLKN